MGRSPRAIRALLRAGADPLLKHQGKELSLNAIGFAYYIGQPELAEFIVAEIEPDEQRQTFLLAEAREDAAQS